MYEPRNVFRMYVAAFCVYGAYVWVSGQRNIISQGTSPYSYDWPIYAEIYNRAVYRCVTCLADTNVHVLAGAHLGRINDTIIQHGNSAWQRQVAAQLAARQDGTHLRSGET